MVKSILAPAAAMAAALMLGSAPAVASTLYSDGAVDGQHDAWTINFGFAVADSFQLATTSTLTGADVAIWNFNGDATSSLDWAILNGSPGAGGSVLASGTASLTDTPLFNNGSYEVSNDSFSLPNLTLGAGTYWLELNNAVASNGDPTYWDMNGGPSQAWESSIGSVTPCDTSYYPTGQCSGTFDIQGTARAPEPASLATIGAVLLGGFIRRRKSA